MFNFKDLSYRKVVLVRGILFTLVLMIGYYFKVTKLSELIIYGSLLPLRLLFYFNMPITKYKVYPTLSFLSKYFITTEDEKLLLDEMSYNAKKGSHLYEQKESNTYFLLTITPSLISFFIVTDMYLFLLFKLVKYLKTIENLFWTVSLFLVLVLVLHLIFNQLRLLNKAKIQDDLNN